MLFLLHFSFNHCLCPFLFLKMCFVWTRAAAAWWRSCRAAQLSCCWQVWLRACSSTRQHQGTRHLPAAAAAGPHRKSRLGLPWFDMFLLFALLYYELSAQRFIITGRFLPCPHLMVFCLADHISSSRVRLSLSTGLHKHLSPGTASRFHFNTCLCSYFSTSPSVL